MRPIGFWSTRTSRRIASAPACRRPRVGSTDLGRRSRRRRPRRCSGSWPRCAQTSSTSAWLTRLDLPEPDTPVTAVNTPSGKRASRSCRLLRVMPRSSSQRVGARGGRGARRRLGEQVARGARGRDVAQPVGRPAVQHLAALLAGVRADVHQPVGAPHHLQVVLDDEQRVALRLQLRQRVEQRLAVGRMQAGGGLVQHVDHAEQVGADLRGQPQALQLAGRQRRRAALQRQIAEPQRPAAWRCARSRSCAMRCAAMRFSSDRLGVRRTSGAAACAEPPAATRRAVSARACARVGAAASRAPRRRSGPRPPAPAARRRGRATSAPACRCRRRRTSPTAPRA